MTIAPNACIVCHTPKPEGVSFGWIYIAGAIPVGAIACSSKCLAVAVERFEKTGRVDQNGTSASSSGV